MTEKKYILYDALPEKWCLGQRGGHTLTISMHPCTLSTVRTRCPDMHSEPNLGLIFQNSADGWKTMHMEIPSAHRRAKKAWEALMYKRATQLRDLLSALHDAPYPDTSERAQLLELTHLGSTRDTKGSLLQFITSPMFRGGLSKMYLEETRQLLYDVRTTMLNTYLRGPRDPGLSLEWFNAKVQANSRLEISCLHAVLFSDPDMGPEYLNSQNMDHPQQLFAFIMGLAHITSSM